MAKILVAGGAGYVGSAACAWLLDRGHDLWVLDDLSTGHREAALGRGFTLCRAGDRDEVRGLLRSERFDCVMHYAASSLISESVAQPDRYFENNVEQTRLLIESMLSCGIRRLIFSSSCSVFGDPGDRRIDEALSKNPLSPYGQTKVQAERLIEEATKRDGLQAVVCRYFNAAGAESRARVGEWHDPETHLIPSVLKAALANRPVEVFGGDYLTPDGTCVRDYVHVTDLARAHEAAMDQLLSLGHEDGFFDSFNLGSEKGFSILDLLGECERILGRKIPYVIKPRRPGDPPRLVADSGLARQRLGFSPSPDSLRLIIESAWNWETKLSKPRKAVFLDRDGTLNPDPGYIRSPGQIELFEGVGEALALLKRAGFQLVVASNQSGVGRGLIDRRQIPMINAEIDRHLRPFGIKIDHWEMCFHRPDEDCECRKPKPKLLLDAAGRMNIDLSESYLIGDKRSDLESGRAARCKAVALVRTGHGAETERKLGPGGAAFVGRDLLEVARWIVGDLGR